MMPLGAMPAADAAPLSAIVSPIQPGSVWTFSIAVVGCENDSFVTIHKFVATDNGSGNKGRYTAVGKHLTMTWKAGSAIGDVLTATYSVKKGIYRGSYTHAGQTFAVTGSPGATGGC